MLLSYKKLFTITFGHDYYGDNEFTGFNIVPSESCGNFFNNASMLSKTIGNTFIALIEEDAGKAKRTVNTEIVFRLYLKFTDPFFTNFTNLNYISKLRQRLYFSNKSNNRINSINFLSASITNYNAAQVYDPGILVRDTVSGKIYECIKTTTIAPVIAIGDTDFWVLKSADAYATEKDRVEVKDTNFTFTTSSASNFFRTKFFAYNNATDAYDIVARADETKNTSPDTTNQVSVNLSGLKEGRYLIDVNGETLEIYYDSYLLKNQYDGVIEIYNNLSGADAYALFDGNGNIKETPFNITLNNKRSIWKYLTTSALIDDITDASGTYTFIANMAKSEFVSNKPIPLSQVQEKTFLLGFSGASPPALKDLKARSPSIAVIQKTGNYYYSEINLSY